MDTIKNNIYNEIKQIIYKYPILKLNNTITNVIQLNDYEFFIQDKYEFKPFHQYLIYIDNGYIIKMGMKDEIIREYQQYQLIQDLNIFLPYKHYFCYDDYGFIVIEEDFEFLQLRKIENKNDYSISIINNLKTLHQHHLYYGGLLSENIIITKSKHLLFFNPYSIHSDKNKDWELLCQYTLGKIYIPYENLDFYNKCIIASNKNDKEMIKSCYQNIDNIQLVESIISSLTNDELLFSELLTNSCDIPYTCMIQLFYSENLKIKNYIIDYIKDNPAIINLFFDFKKYPQFIIMDDTLEKIPSIINQLCYYIEKEKLSNIIIQCYDFYNQTQKKNLLYCIDKLVSIWKDNHC